MYFWQAMAIFFLLAFCWQALLHGMWLSLSIAIVAIVAEIWWMKAWARQRNREKARPHMLQPPSEFCAH
jgi:hypothetical protein